LSPGASFAAAPPPLVSASPAPALKVIANVRSTSRCAEIVTHANSAIGSALNNDVQLQQLITRLRAINLDDGNLIHRRNGLDALGEFAKNLTQQSRSADDEVKRLRALAEKSTDPQEQKELKAFADALGGALWRQQKVARDLNGYLASVDFQDMATFTEGQEAANRAVFGVPDPFISTVSDTKPNPGVDRNRGTIDVEDVNVMLDGKFMAQVDILAARRGLQSADDYLAQWQWGDEQEREGSAREVAAALKAELEAKGW